MTLQQLSISSQIGISTIAFFAWVLLPVGAQAATNIQEEVHGATTLYTYTSECSPRIMPPSSGLSKEVGIIVPELGARMDRTVWYFHGNDQPTIADICDGSTYHICDAADAMGSPVIIPRVAVQGSSSKPPITTGEFNCMLNEAKAVMANAGITLEDTYTVAGHSGGGFTMSSYFAAGLSAEKAIVLDGCYVGSGGTNFCQTILNYFDGPVDMYYQGTGETATESQAAKQIAPGRVTLKKVNLSHEALASACLIEPNTCGGKVIDTSPTGQGGSTSPSSTPTGQGGTSPSSAPSGGSSSSGGTTGATTANVETVNLVNPLGGNDANPQGTTDIATIIGGVLGKLLGVVGGIAFLAFIIGGAYWLISAGNSDRVQKGTATMTWAAIGLAVVFSSYGILYTVIGGLTNNKNLSTPKDTTANGGTTISAYYIVGTELAPILAQPSATALPRGGINKTVTCVPGTGKEENGFVQVSDPGNPALIGWVRQDLIRKMSQEEVTTARCGVPKS